jgi:hypothetical protein
MTVSVGAQAGRTLWEALADIPDWRGRKGRQYPLRAVLSRLAGAAQVGRIHRIREVAGRIRHETVYVITSLTREQASADPLLALNRRHWSIENSLHWRRDAGLAENASHLRCGNAPQALASMHNTVLRLLQPFPIPTRAARQVFAENRLCAIALALQGFL